MAGTAPGPTPSGGAFDLGSAMAAAQAALAADKLDEVERLCNIVLANQPAFPPATFFLAIVATKRGDPQSAIALLKGIVQVNPNAFEALEWLANLQRELGEFEDAMRTSAQMIRLRPSHPGGQTLTGMCYIGQGLPAKALPHFQKAVALAPDAPAFHLHLARTLEQLQRPQDAESEYRTAIRLAPDLAMLHEALGKMLFVNGRKEQALDCLREAVRLEPKPDALLLLASGLTESGRHAEAVPYFRKATEIEPSLVDAHELLGYALQVLGRFEEAEACLHQAVELDPARARAYLALASAKMITENDLPLIRQIEQLAADASRRKDDLRQLNYALGKAYTDLGQFAEAMNRYDKANEFAFIAQLKMVPYDLEAQRAWTDRVVATFMSRYFETHRDVGSDSELPVFIVGMIRSGTTLADQVLSSHPQIGSADELQYWIEPPRIKLIQSLMEGAFPRPKLLAAAEEHLSQLQQAASGNLRVTDKMPRNYLTLGIIHLLFPKARIIHCKRDPIDTCLSIYTTPFGKGAEFCYNRQSIVDAYREYGRLMEHWRTVIPGEQLLEINYEDLVANPEAVAREMVSFCGLEWSDACLRPEENERPVNTPSLWQVRQPVYKTSVGRSSRFEGSLREFATLREGPSR